MRAVALLLLMLAGCGFEPLYGRTDTRPSVTEQLAAIEIVPIPNREGQILYNFLRDRIAPTGLQGPPRYRLEVELEERRRAAFVRLDATATRYNYELSADYRLLDGATGRLIVDGTARSSSSYNVLRSPFPTLYSEADSRIRAARAISDDIRTRLASYLKARQ